MGTRITGTIDDRRRHERRDHDEVRHPDLEARRGRRPGDVTAFDRVPFRDRSRDHDHLEVLGRSAL